MKCDFLALIEKGVLSTVPILLDAKVPQIKTPHMRFNPNGPMIPDELLVARDKGEVVFFCGAGVSQASAGLDNFLQLAKKVIGKLGAAADSPARKLLDAALKSVPIEGVGGFVATDRIFSLLEREFDVSDIHSAVARALRPKAESDLKAHRTVLALASVDAGEYRIVTTNFDLLFEACDTAIPSIGPLSLPDLRRSDFRGIVHLHGRVDQGYKRSDDHGFVLSSADFGRAYLADGWAAGFIRSLIERYYVVFLGYSADDPPVQYLLEALGSSTKAARRMFAFQSGDSGTAASLWSQKGVHAIPYDPSNRHSALWDTLEAWAIRAHDPDGWHANVVETSLVGPEKLAPYVRGQVAHIFSTEAGLEKVIGSSLEIPASWLRTLDPRSRYRTPSLRLSEDDVRAPDPFDSYCIDEDTTPDPFNPDDAWKDRDVPIEAWDAFKAVDSLKDIEQRSSPLSLLTFDGSHNLPKRLQMLAHWMKRVLHQHVALVWALEQREVHPYLKEQIHHAVRHERSRFGDDIARGWSALLRAWEDRRQDPDSVAFAVSIEVNQSGWTEELVRRLLATRCPKLRLSGSSYWDEEEPSKHLYSVSLDYPRPHDEPVIPDEFLSYGVAELRRHLELAASYMREFREHSYLYMTTSRAEDGAPPLSDDKHGVVGPVIHMQNLMDRLSKYDPVAAHAEFLAWPRCDSGIFTRLRIWAMSNNSITSADEAAAIVLGLDDRAFWGERHRRDLAYSIRDRWPDFPPLSRHAIEQRILVTSFPWTDKQEARAVSHDAQQKHALITWLSGYGLAFSFEVDDVLEVLAAKAGNELVPPASFIGSNEPQVFSIRSDNDPARLLDISLRDVLLASLQQQEIDFAARTQRDSFAGLVEALPVRALSVLGVAARTGTEASVAWRTFLQKESRSSDSLRMVRLIAGRLLQMSNDRIAKIDFHFGDWLKRLATRLYSDLPELLQRLWQKLLSVLKLGTSSHRSDVSNRSWADDALNSATGRLTEVLFLDPGYKAKEGVLPEGWKTRFEELLSLPGGLRPQVVSLAAFQLVNLFHRDMDWILRVLVPLHEDAKDDGDAFWDGFLWRNHVPQDELMPVLKSTMIALARHPKRTRSGRDALICMLLYFWFRSQRGPTNFVYDDELREVLIQGGMDLARTAIWHLKHSLGQMTPSELSSFFENVWPKQKALRTSQISNSLVTFALSSGEALPSITPILLPRLIAGESFDLSAFLYNQDVDDTIKRFPRESFELLLAVIKPETAAGQYGLSRVLDKFANTPELEGDVRLAKLRRKVLN